YDIAVIRDRHSKILDQIYFAFAIATDKRLINFDLQSGKEAEIAKGIQVQGARMVFFAGNATSAMLKALDPKLPVLLVSHDHNDELPELKDRTVVTLAKDLYANQVLSILGELFPGKRRIGFAYNPKLTQEEIDEYKKSPLAKELNLILLKI